MKEITLQNPVCYCRFTVDTKNHEISVFSGLLKTAMTFQRQRLTSQFAPFSADIDLSPSLIVEEPIRF
jgi:hypothetical protein